MAFVLLCRCFWCDTVIPRDAEALINYPSGKVKCQQCRDHDEKRDR